MKRRMTPKEELLEGAANIGAALAFIGFLICGGAMNIPTAVLGMSMIAAGITLMIGIEALCELAGKIRRKRARKILRLAEQIKREMGNEMWEDLWDAAED